MTKWLNGFMVLALGATVLTGCTESGSDRVGERPGDRTPAASPPATTAPRPGDSTTPPASTTTPGSTTTTPGGTTTTPGGTTGTGTR
jgi:hypothetical protein